MTVVSATEVQNNFGHYLSRANAGEEIAITKNGKIWAHLLSSAKKREFLIDSIRGIISNTPDREVIRTEKRARYENLD